MAEPDTQSSQPSIAGVLVGARVVRNPEHWLDVYGNQDGGEGTHGTVIELRQWGAGRNVTADTIAVRVRWDTGAVNSYRWSASGPQRDLLVVGFRPLMPGDEASPVHEGVAAFYSRQAAHSGVREALLRLRNETGGSKGLWTTLRGWDDAGRDPCAQPSWEGVTCTDGEVVGLDLARIGMHGDVPASTLCESELGHALQSLNLGYNSLHGPIPLLLCHCRSLRFLDLSHNSLAGTLPPCMGTLAPLETIYLHSNKLQGGVPPEWGALGSGTLSGRGEGGEGRDAQGHGEHGVQDRGVRTLQADAYRSRRTVASSGSQRQRPLSMLHLHNNVDLAGALPAGLAQAVLDGSTRVTCTGTGLECSGISIAPRDREL